MIARLLYHRRFIKNFNKRIVPFENLAKLFKKRMKLFIQNPQHPLLRDHALIGKRKNQRSFSITGDIRIVYKKDDEDEITLLDIGTHSQVY